MLNSAEHEILNAYKYNNIKQFSFLLAHKPIILFFLLIYVEMPTLVGILTLISSKNNMLSLWQELRNNILGRNLVSFTDALCCPRKQTESHKNCLPLKIYKIK